MFGLNLARDYILTPLSAEPPDRDRCDRHTGQIGNIGAILYRSIESFFELKIRLFSP